MPEIERWYFYFFHEFGHPLGLLINAVLIPTEQLLATHPNPEYHDNRLIPPFHLSRRFQFRTLMQFQFSRH